MAENKQENIPGNNPAGDKDSKGGASLENLLNSLHKEIKTSDWLKQNTAEKWMAENKEAADEILKAREAQAKGDNLGS